MKTRLKEIIAEKGITSRALAKRMQMSEVTVSELVNGKNRNIETFAKAAQCLGVPMWQLFRDPDHSDGTYESIEEGGDTMKACEPSTTDTAQLLCPHCGGIINIKVEK